MVRVAGVFPLFPACPLIPYEFLECLRPRKPAPAEAGIILRSTGWGPSPASMSSAGSPASGSHPNPAIRGSPPPSPTAMGFPLRRPQNPPIPAPKSRRRGGRLPVIPTTCPRPWPHHSHLRLPPMPPGANPRAGSWTWSFAEPFPKSRGRPEPRPNQREGSR